MREGCKLVSCSASASSPGSERYRFGPSDYDEIGLLRPAKVDPLTGYRCYLASQLGQLNRIVALKELGLSLAQAKQLLAGITPQELQGMLMLRGAQLEQELAARENQLLEVEARLGYISKEGTMPAGVRDRVAIHPA